MPFDSPPPRRPIGPVSDQVVADLREALRLRLDGRALNGELQRALHTLCREARERGIRAEQVIVLLKQVWCGLPEQPTDLGPHERRQILEGLITLCVDEFYADE